MVPFGGGGLIDAKGYKDSQSLDLQKRPGPKRHVRFVWRKGEMVSEENKVLGAGRIQRGQRVEVQSDDDRL